MSQLALSDDLIEITAEINSYKQVAGQAVFEIGKRLKHVKDNDLVHGQWENWLKSVDMVPQTARKMIQAFEQFGNRATSSELPIGKMFEMLSLPETVDRQQFITETQTIPSTGEQKTVDDMTVKELREVKKALQEAERRAAQAEATADTERNRALHAEKLFNSVKNQPPRVETRVVEKIPSDYQDLKQQAVIAQQLNADNVKLQREINNLKHEHAEKTSQQQNDFHAIRKMRESFKNILSQVNQEHYNAKYFFEQTGSTPQAHESVDAFLKEFNDVIDQIFRDWKEKTHIKVS